MQTLNIKQLSKLYHLHPEQRDRQRLLDACLNDAIEEHLEFALTEAGIDDEEEICLRLVHVPLSFNFGQSQSATSQHWSSIISRHVRLQLDKGGANVVRYRSRLHALFAFAEDISRHQMQRSWAWNQIGLANLRMGSNLEQARTQLVTALVREPAATGAIFTRLAVQQRLLSWLGEMSRHDRSRLLNGILAEAGVDRRWLDVRPNLADADEPLPGTLLSNEALSSSSILNHLQANVGNTAWQSLHPRAWVVLILLELEPLLFRRANSVVTAAIATVEKNLLPVLVANSDRADAGSEHLSTEHTAKSPQLRSVKRPGQLAVQKVEKPPEVSQQVSADIANGHETGIEPGSTNVVTTPGDTAARRSSELTDQGRANPRRLELPAEPQATPAQTAESVPARQFITSEFAGLFLLLPLLAETTADDSSSLIDQIVADPAFDSRPLSWVLYRLTNVWLPIPTDDPALRAFCDIDIDAEWPWSADDAATTHEHSVLAHYAARIETSLCSKVRSSEFASPSVIEGICRRYARLLIDSGWLELVFSLDRVDTEIRRAGLDLDPGFVPWLGKVVKIRYE